MKTVKKTPLNYLSKKNFPHIHLVRKFEKIIKTGKVEKRPAIYKFCKRFPCHSRDLEISKANYDNVAYE